MELQIKLQLNIEQVFFFTHCFVCSSLMIFLVVCQTFYHVKVPSTYMYWFGVSCDIFFMVNDECRIHTIYWKILILWFNQIEISLVSSPSKPLVTLTFRFYYFIYRFLFLFNYVMGSVSHPWSHELLGVYQSFCNQCRSYIPWNRLQRRLFISHSVEFWRTKMRITLQDVMGVFRSALHKCFNRWSSLRDGDKTSQVESLQFICSYDKILLGYATKESPVATDGFACGDRTRRLQDGRLYCVSWQ